MTDPTLNQSNYKVKAFKTRHLLFNTWKGMLSRCYKNTNSGYINYQRRGITVCNEWRNDFWSFAKWTETQIINPGMTLDRRNNDLGYYPDNCRFIYRAEQQRNRYNNVWVTAFGETKVLFDWANDERCVVSGSALRIRLQRGMNPESAITLLPKSAGVPKRKYSLNDDTALEAYRLVTEEHLSHEKVGLRLGVDRANISCLIRGEIWKHLGLPPIITKPRKARAFATRA